MTDKVYTKEHELCTDFIAHNLKYWDAYPETQGWDILMVRKSDGFQIGIQAKLKLNAKVITQAAEDHGAWASVSDGPDCRAVLVPYSCYGSDFRPLLHLLGITPIFFGKTEYEGLTGHVNESPSLPHGLYCWGDWYEMAPLRREQLPPCIPDVQAGASAPKQLTGWKVKAIRIAVTLEKEKVVTRHHFKHHDISMTLWTQKGWIYRDEVVKGYRAGERMPDFRLQHPVNFGEIEAKYDEWRMP